MAPIVDGLEEQYGRQMAIRRINAGTGDGPAIMRDYRIPGHPTILLFDHRGNEIQRLAGPQTAETVANFIEDILAKSR